MMWSPDTIAPHLVLGTSLSPPFPPDTRQVMFGMGCFWGAERRFWQQPGIHVTAVGYAGGTLPDPSYDQVCTGRTGHAEVVLVVFWPEQITLTDLLTVFWESHDPTQGMRQGNDIGPQYRSAVFLTDEGDMATAISSLRVYQDRLSDAGFGPVTTEIACGVPFYYAEADHQQYLAANPHGYCGLRGTGVPCR